MCLTRIIRTASELPIRLGRLQGGGETIRTEDQQIAHRFDVTMECLVPNKTQASRENVCRRSKHMRLPTGDVKWKLRAGAERTIVTARSSPPSRRSPGAWGAGPRRRPHCGSRSWRSHTVGAAPGAPFGHGVSELRFAEGQGWGTANGDRLSSGDQECSSRAKLFARSRSSPRRTSMSENLVRLVGCVMIPFSRGGIHKLLSPGNPHTAVG